MKKLLFCIILALLGNLALQAQQLVNTWKVVRVNGNTLSEGTEVSMTFTEDGRVIMAGAAGSQTANYTLGEDAKTLTIQGEKGDEEWQIASLTETELIIKDPNNGEFVLQLTDAIELPEEEIQPEKAQYSVESDFKPSKKDAKLIIGSWQAQSFNGSTLPAEVKISITFEKNGTLKMFANESLAETGSYKIAADGKKLEISGDEKNEIWGIKALNKTTLTLLDRNVGEIVLVKKAKK